MYFWLKSKYGLSLEVIGDVWFTIGCRIIAYRVGVIKPFQSCWNPFMGFEVRLYNCCIGLETSSPDEVLHQLLKLRTLRQKALNQEGYQSRTIDLDILL